MKKNAVIGIIGRDEYYKTWFSVSPNYDIHLIIYNDLELPKEYKDRCKTLNYRKGYSGEILKWFFEDCLDINEYDYYWLPNDDITINPDDINKLFELMESEGLTLAAPSLEKSDRTHTWWKILNNRGSGIRPTKFVEGMMPCYEVSFLKQILPLCDETKSGWGVDVVMSKMCYEQGKRIVIIDDIIVKHNSKQGDPNSELSKKLKADKVDSRNEFFQFISKYNGIEYYSSLLNLLNSNEENTLKEKKGTKIKVLFTMYGWNESGGGTIYPKAIAKELVRRGYDVSVFYADLKNNPEKPAYSIEKSEDEGVLLFGLYNRPAVFIDPDNPEREINDEEVLKRFEEVCDEVLPDIIHFHNFHGLTFAMARIAYQRHIPSCYTPHNYHLIDPNLYLFNSDLSLWNGVDLIENSSAVKQNPGKIDLYKQRIQTTRTLLNEWVDITLAVSIAQRELLIAHGGNENKIVVVHQANPINDDLWNNQLLEEYSKREIGEHLRLGFIGGVMPHKGVHLIVAAAQYFMPQDIEFHIYGFASAQYLSVLKDIDKKNIVKFHGEYNNSQFAEIAENLDVAIFPSIWEDCAPLVLLELNAMRLPVIAANIGGIPDFIKDGVNGYLYQYDSVESLIKTIMYLNANPGFVRNMRQNMKQVHSFKIYMNHLENIYDKLIKRKIKSYKDLWLTINFDDFNSEIASIQENEIKVAPDEDSIRKFLSNGGIEIIEFKKQNEDEDSTVLNLTVKVKKTVEIEEFLDLSEKKEFNTVNNIELTQNKDLKNNINKQASLQSQPSDFLGFSFNVKEKTNTIEEHDIKNNFEDMQPPYLNVVWEGSQFVYHSLALINREHCSNLIDTGLVEVIIIPYEKDQYSLWGDEKYGKLIRHDIRYKPEAPENIRNLPYIWIRHQWPPQSDPPQGAKWIINQPWEYSQLRKDFVEIFKNADEIWTPSNYSRKCFIDSGLDFNKVQIIPNGIDPELFKPSGDIYPLETNKKLKFLFVGGTIFRKGCDILINAYTQAFTKDDNVCLIIKDMGGDSFYRGQTLKEQIIKHQEKGNSPEIIYFDNYMPEAEITSLYRACDVFVCSYRGEGFSLPTLEAMACGLPVIVTDGGSTDDFVSDDCGWKIPAKKVSIGNKIGEQPLTGEAFVLEPDIDYLIKLFKIIYLNPSDIFQKAVHAQYNARTLWTWKRATLKIFARLDVLYGMNIQREAVKILKDKEDEYIIIAKAEEQFHKRNFDKSLKLYFKALNSSDLSDNYRLLCLCRLSDIYLAKKDLKQVEEYLAKAMELAPGHPETKYIQAKIFSEQKKWTESMETFSEILNNWKIWKYDTLTGLSQDELITGTADGIFNTGDPEGAYRLYSEALKINNNNANACLGAAKYMLLLDLKEEAKNMLEWAVKLDPYLEEAWDALNSL